MGDIFPHMSDAEYFAAEGLSHSDTKLLARSPAYYRYVKTTGNREVKSEYDFGHAVHELLLGKGGGIDVIDAKDWRTKAAKEARDESRAAGRAPMLQHEYDQAKACADGVSLHPLARKILDGMEHAELAMFWDDDGVARKAKIDAVFGRFGVDVKTTDYADTEAFGRSAGKYGYATQDAWYREALAACLGIKDPGFLFLVVEKNPPYLVNVIQLDPYDVELGHRRNRQMIELFRQCRDADEWPAYGTGINQAQLPRWAEIEMEVA